MKQSPLGLGGCDWGQIMSEERRALKEAPTSWFARLARRALLCTPKGKANYDSLCQAAKEGDLARVRQLLPLVGAWGWASDPYTPLAWAAGSGSADCVEALLPASDAAQADKRGGVSALMLAAHSESARCVELLLPHSDPLWRNEQGSTALMAAARGAKGADCVKALAPRSDALSVDRLGLSALHHAANRGNAACVAALIPWSDPNMLCPRGRTPLMHAALSGDLESVALLLPISNAAHVDEDGWSALEIAKNDGMKSIIELIEGSERSRLERLSLLGALEAAAGASKPGARL